MGGVLREGGGGFKACCDLEVARRGLILAQDNGKDCAADDKNAASIFIEVLTRMSSHCACPPQCSS